MPDRTPRSHPPLVLIANGQEWHTRSLESILGPHGYAVLRAYTGKQALERAHGAQPDVIIVDADLPDMDGLEVCRALRDNPRISASTPILVTSASHPNRQQRLDALRAGAWDYLTRPLDGEELQLRLDAYVRAKFEADRAREEGLLDELTGLYNIRGLARRARELGSQAFRNSAPFACVVFAPHVEVEEMESAEAEAAASAAAERLAKALRDSGRVSDAIGRLGPSEFAVIAQGTDAEGAVKLAERLARTIEGTGEGSTKFRMRAGYDAVSNYHEAPIEPADMLVRATIAMRTSQAESDGGWIRPFEPRFSN
ncbi:MAG: response regulator [Gemmatimonadetes bacterium]|nr:response regulator [Gemmatimonadota bacterium]